MTPTHDRNPCRAGHGGARRPPGLRRALSGSASKLLPCHSASVQRRFLLPPSARRAWSPRARARSAPWASRLSPGSRMERRRSRRPRRAAWRAPPCHLSRRPRLIACRCPAAPSPCPPARRPTRRCRGSAPPRAGRRRRETTARRGSRTGRPAGRTGPRDRRWRGSAATTPRATAMVRSAMRADGLLMYNERDNLEPMGARARSTPSVHVLVIDDNSPDGTGAIADGLAAEVPWVEVLHRANKEGLGEGVPPDSTAHSRRAPSSCSRSDCDFSHDPKRGASPHRHLRGGCRSRPRLPLDRGWGHWSTGAADELRREVELPRPHDPWCCRGFKCFRRIVQETLRSRRDRGQGYGLLQTTYRALRVGSGWSRSRSCSSTAAPASRRWTARSWSRRCSRCVLRHRALRGRL